ncbi:MAG: Gfo/Idh/MocA family oxidoreductase [Kutzneria sp.]|nr:Gfo/Idh/MocA family oxidoreductase [Kutzneria sp.]MBV9845729.1 Gfo/Idh/MocA family oxidoreductase [Kutzneria sp.]
MFAVEEQLRVGLVGAGPWARAVHAPGIADHPGTRLVSVWTRSGSNAEDLAGRYGAEVSTDPRQLIDQVDAVAFAVPPQVQAELAVTAARAGKHVVLDKPLAGDLTHAREVADAIAAADVASLIMLTRRFEPETVEWLTDLRRLGGWTGGAAKWLSGALLGGEYAGSRWRHAQGALIDVGPHTIDLLDTAIGRVTEVVAAYRGEPDLWHLMLAHENGATSTVSMSLRMPTKPTVIEFAVYGEHGYRTLTGPPASSQACYAALLDDFVAMVRSGVHSHPCDARRGLHLQGVLDQALAKLAQAT